MGIAMNSKNWRKMEKERKGAREKERERNVEIKI